MTRYIQGDIHSVIKTLEDNSIDFIYTNPPFGITKKEWDKPLDWDNLWSDIWRVLKPNGVVGIHASMPFSYDLIKSQRPKYHYIWKKNNSTSFLNANKQPLRTTEEIYIFYNSLGTYNIQMIGNKIYKKRKVQPKIKSSYYGCEKGTNTDEIQIGNYPTNFLDYPIKIRGGKTVPDEMIEFFIKTYSNENDTILDMTCHNKIVGNITTKLKRNYIGVDINEIN
jgi:site-specific DNA-methyltransferase (adenine-specific)